jgi:hypothetical protein
MAFLGDIGVTTIIGLNLPGACFSALALAVQPTGNGPISNSAPFVAAAFATINLNGVKGAQMDRDAYASAAGIWEFNDLAPGTYFATEAGVSRQWRIDVAADLSFTVTPITSSFPRTRSYASA